jgi:enoyl-CoA hydratase/carnithine racemase
VPPANEARVTYTQLIYEPGPVGRIILNRPEYRNALSRVLMEEVDAAFDEAAADPDVRTIVLSGNGPSFCAGLDRGSPPEVQDRENRPPSDDPQEQYQRSWHMGIGRQLRLRRIPKPTIAMVHGYCINAGTMLIGGLDLIFAAEDATISFVDSQHPGLIDGPASARRLKDVLFEGRPVSGIEAHELGFVSRVYPADQLEEQTLAYAARVAERHPWQLAMIKHSINARVEALGYDSSLEVAFHALNLTRTVGGPPNVGRNRRGPESMPGAQATKEAQS